METTRTKKVIKVPRKVAIILGVVIVIILGFILFNQNQNQYRDVGVTPPMGSPAYDTGILETGTRAENSVSAPSATSMPEYYPYYPDPYQNPSSVKDTREFMKVSYGAEIKTRDVKDVMGDVKNAIRDADGRIDNSTENPKYSYVSFVIPKNNFNNFKAEIESLTNEKLYTENSSSQNLLGQKQSIEEQKASATSALAELQKKQKNLAAQHTQTVNALQKELDATPPQNQQRIAQLQASLYNENTSYAANNQNLKNQISAVNAQLANVAKQDVAFTENIETVNGYISVNWVSLWEMLKILSPIHPGIIIIALVVLTWYYLSRKNYLPRIEFV